MKPPGSGSKNTPPGFPADSVAQPDPSQSPSPENAGAYRLFLKVNRAAWIEVGRRGRFRIEPGYYVYIGSARRNLRQRVARHRQIASGHREGGHWHVDSLLAHRSVRLIAAESVSGGEECRLSQSLALQPGVGIPIAGFGATDCRAGCKAHLYRIPASMAPVI